MLIARIALIAVPVSIVVGYLLYAAQITSPRLERELIRQREHD